MWKTFKLGDLATFVNGYAFKPSDWGNKGLPIIRIQNLTKSSKEINYYSSVINDKYLIKDGDILISWSASLGVYEWNGGKALLNQHIFKVVFDKMEINKRFFIYVIKKELENMIKNTHGSTMKHITKKRFDNLCIKLPSLQTQRKIVEVLDKAQELIDARKQQIKLLDDLISSVFYNMFGDPITNPKGWEVRKLKDVTNKITDGVHNKPEYTESGVPFISVKDIGTGNVIFEHCKFISKEAHNKYTCRCKPEIGDILYTKVGARYGIPAVIETDNEFSIYVSVALIKPIKNCINSIFLKKILKTPYVYRQAVESIKGIGVPDLHLIEIKKFNIVLPPIELQNQFAQIVQQIENQKQLMEQSLTEMENNFNNLMQKAFKGELFID